LIPKTAFLVVSGVDSTFSFLDIRNSFGAYLDFFSETSENLPILSNTTSPFSSTAPNVS
jgi:hypothetical protein